jgi:uncharacterized membrane protein/nitrite reductase/ring-hydroxylating ferredoxin subunit
MKSKASFKSHPLHPILVAFPIAFLVGTLLCDIVWFLTDDDIYFTLAGYLEGAGIVTALIAAVPGAVDYFMAVPPGSSANKRATSHALINILNVVIFSVAFVLRHNDYTSALILIGIELVGVVLLSVAGWLGGTLVYRNQIGVDHRYAGAGKWKELHLPEQAGMIEVAAADELKLNQMKLVHIGPKRIALGRTEDGYAAFDDFCTHRGGPLSDGAMICGTVQCPWHGSQFDVKTGQIKAGPAKEVINVYETREEGGRVYVFM